MAKTIKVTRTQIRAARLMVKRAEEGRGTASDAVRAIAQARPAGRPTPRAVAAG